MEGHDFLTAHFCNNERTVVEVFWVTPDGKETRVEYVEPVDGDEYWESILAHCDIDTIHKNTYRHIREQNQLFEDQVIAIAKERGLIIDVDDLNADINSYVIKTIFDKFDPENDKEKLFLYKLKLFEVDAIKESNNKDLKKKLRQSKTVVEATQIACNIVLSSGT